MKLHIWTDRFSYLAVAHADSVSKARELLLKESDLGESGDGSCPERDRARRAILSETSSVYVGRVAEFSLSDNAQLREQEDNSEKLYQQIAAKDRRIAELEAALSARPCPMCNNGGAFPVEHRDQDGNYLGTEQVQCDCQVVKPYSALDALLAKAKRETIDRCITIAKGCEDYGGGYREQDLEIYHHGMQTVHRCLMQLRDGDESLQLRMAENIGRRMAREVKP